MSDTEDEHAPARGMVRAAKPLERAMFLFNQPPGMETPEMRRKAAQVLGFSVALQVFVFWVTPYLMKYQGPVSQLGFFVMIAVFGAAFLLVPASLFRVIYGVTDKDDGNGIVRGFVAFTLFLLTCFASCYVYANITK
jgi:hypothetical protein